MWMVGCRRNVRGGQGAGFLQVAKGRLRIVGGMHVHSRLRSAVLVLAVPRSTCLAVSQIRRFWTGFPLTEASALETDWKVLISSASTHQNTAVAA
jgi:hypothetical protein